ncbi:HTH-type transcriptional regulator YidZ [bioreactor metagenome]|uniref:HTH-type transcriptional regulator YidZ n=1 Tax=bioreactor metagenome TaxID=1076179 RepID=A0A644Z430_9ZZZZ
MIDLHHLRTFITVTQESHLSRAAERLHISQPAASQHIRALEDHFDIPLFARTAKGLTPTAAGLQLYENALEIVASVMRLDEILDPLKSSLQGDIVIGTVYAPQLIRELTKFSSWILDNHPLIHLSIENRNSNSVLNGINSAELDIGFFLGNDHPAGINTFAVGTLQFHLCFHEKWKIQIQDLDWNQIATLPWILMPQDNPIHTITRNFLREKGIYHLSKSITVNNNAVMCEMIKSGIGIGFMKPDAASHSQHPHRILEHPSAVISTKIFCGCLHSRSNHPTVRTLLNQLRQMALPGENHMASPGWVASPPIRPEVASDN